METDFDSRGEHLQFAAFMHRVRALGIGLAALPVAAVLHLDHAGPGLWLPLLANALVWPHLAWWLARRSAQPTAAEKRNQLFDAVVAGAWIAAMHYDPLPSVLMVSLIAMSHIASGGLRWLARTLPLLVVCAVLLGVGLRIPWRAHDAMLVTVSTLPLLAIYPSCLSYVSFKLGRRVRQQNRLLAELSRTDPLTGLANRGAWLGAARHELERYLRHRGAVSLVLLDLDHFKVINDRFGHTTGDTALQALARILGANLRSADTAGRFDGDEFGIVLPDTGTDAAREVTERIRRQVAGIHPGGHEHACSVSVGVAQLTPDCTSLKAWIERADVALYRAKAAGRNRVCCAAST